MALQRHIARRGRPSIIYSDNGTNSVGLNNALKKIDFKRLAEKMTLEQIEWKFNPPSSIVLISDGYEKSVPLTPSMFLQEIKEIGVVDLDCLEITDFNKRYTYRQKIKSDLRQRFRTRTCKPNGKVVDR